MSGKGALGASAFPQTGGNQRTELVDVLIRVEEAERDTDAAALRRDANLVLGEVVEPFRPSGSAEHVDVGAPGRVPRAD